MKRLPKKDRCLDMAEKSVKKNYLYNVGYQIMLLIVPLVVTPYVSRVLGADGIGIYSYINSVVSYFVLFATLGTITYGQREIAYFQHDTYKRSIAFWEIFIIRLFGSLILTTIYVAFCFWHRDNRIIYLIFTFNILSVITDISWYFQGMEEFKKIVLRNVIFKIVNIIFIFVFVKTKNDLPIYIMGMCAIPMVGNFLLWFSLRGSICKIHINQIKPFKRVKGILLLFVPTIAIQVYTVLDKTMIGVITKNSFENGYYDQAEKLAKMALAIVTSLGAVLIPRIGAYFAQNKYEEIKEYMYKSYRFVWMIATPLCLGMIGVSSNFIPWFLGTGYDDVIPLLKVLSFLILAIGINNVTGMQYLIPTKRENTFTLTVCIGAGVNLVGNLVLIPLIGAMGAAIATVLAEATIAVVQIFIVRKELSMKHIIKVSWKYLISGMIMLGGVELSAYFFSPSILNTIILVMVGGSLYFLLLLLMKDEMIIYILNRIFIKKKNE